MDLSFSVIKLPLQISPTLIAGADEETTELDTTDEETTELETADEEVLLDTELAHLMTVKELVLELELEFELLLLLTLELTELELEQFTTGLNGVVRSAPQACKSANPARIQTRRKTKRKLIEIVLFIVV